MIYTNIHNLREPFVRAYSVDKYSKGHSDFTATGLWKLPRAVVLAERHPDSLTIDVSARFNSVLGRAIHSMMEEGARPGIDIVEKRYYSPFVVSGETYIVSAQIDLYESDTKTLFDYKSSLPFGFHKKGKPKTAEWEAQLNVGKLLMEEAGIEVKALEILGIIPGWDRRLAELEPGYPSMHSVSKPIKVWPREKTIDYIRTKIEGILKARIDLPSCPASELWGGKRCKNYCEVASVCTQYQETKKTGLLRED